VGIEPVEGGALADAGFLAHAAHAITPTASPLPSRQNHLLTSQKTQPACDP